MAVRSVGVVGSGIMGRGIAEVAAAAGHEVVLRSRAQQTAEEARAAIAGALDRRVAREALTAAERDSILARVTPTAELDDLCECDLVIESVPEVIATKKQLFAELDRACKPEAVLATNTSTLPVVDIAVSTSRPDRVCGLHFFNPATVMALVEVVRPMTACDETIGLATEFARACGKRPVVVRDQAGFIVNALLFPYLNNAVRMLETGAAPPEEIDEAMKGGCGFKMGPFALLDLIGLDTSLAILDALYEEYREPNYAPVPRLRRMVAAGRLGRKSGTGFYDYEPQ